MDARLEQYLATMDQRRQKRLAEQWGALTEREQKLVREAAVMGFVRGNQLPTGQIPRDGVITLDVLGAADSFTDLYPTLAGLGRPEGWNDLRGDADE